MDWSCVVWRPAVRQPAGCTRAMSLQPSMAIAGWRGSVKKTFGFLCLSFARMLPSCAGVAFSSHSRQDEDVIQLTLLLLRAITLACRGHHDVVLENLALRHQLRTLPRRVKRPDLRTRDRGSERRRDWLVCRVRSPINRPPPF